MINMQILELIGMAIVALVILIFIATIGLAIKDDIEWRKWRRERRKHGIYHD